MKKEYIIQIYFVNLYCHLKFIFQNIFLKKIEYFKAIFFYNFAFFYNNA